MKSLHQRVEEIVKSDGPKCTNRRTIARVWYVDMIRLGIPKSSARKIALLVASGKLTSTHSIVRARQRCTAEIRRHGKD